MAKRTIFDTEREMRFFLARLAGAVRRGELEIHAFALLRNHFHLLVRSLEGKLSAAMRRAEADHARRFNFVRQRRGPLFQGRFYSGRVPDLARALVVRYIDDNPVRGGMTACALDYKACSAFWHARGTGAPWLDRRWVDRAIEASGVPDRRAAYRSAFPSGVEPGLREWVDRRLSRGAGRRDDLAALLGAPEPAVEAWIRERAHLADGGPSVAASVPWPYLLEAAASHTGLVKRSVLVAGLASVACGYSITEIASKLEVGRTTAGHRVRRHRELVEVDAAYAAASATVLHAALRRLTQALAAPDRAGLPDQPRDERLTSRAVL